jgi:hypothetical protein
MTIPPDKNIISSEEREELTNELFGHREVSERPFYRFLVPWPWSRGLV